MTTAPKPEEAARQRIVDSKEEPQKVLGDYVLGKTLGEGTFGKVRIAVHTPTGEKVAVKVLEKSKIKEPADIIRVKREIKILKRVRHPNVIQLYEVIDTKNAIYLVMENVPGGEMFDYIVAHKHVQEKQACKFFHQIVDGLEEIHKSEVTHRDLKPENLLLKPSPQGWMVKIVDFGLSNTHEGGTAVSFRLNQTHDHTYRTASLDCLWLPLLCCSRDDRRQEVPGSRGGHMVARRDSLRLGQWLPPL